MSDLRQQVRDHYDAQPLSPEKVQALLLAGRTVAPAGDGAAPEPEENMVPFPRRKSWTAWVGALAACLAISLAGLWWMMRDAGDVSYAALPPRVIEFFTNKEEIVPAPQDKREVKAWLVSNGAPAEMVIPASLQKLESAACQVVDVRGAKAYLSCYWTESGPDRGLPQLMHLLVSRAEDFRDQPQSATAVVREMDGWSFASWAEGDVLYTMAAAAPKEKLQPFLNAGLENSGATRRFISTVVFPTKVSQD
ncbi:MAG: hypothetical protein EOP87_06885 [Verrucomicrobiaceae bacterium]|nr:MAG: hypothetical protein EOP87_06885 [Verrucomicrobiaceae bacterium]